MFDLPNDLATRSEPILVGVLGVGQLGTKLVDQIEGCVGMTTAAIAEREEENAMGAYREAGVPPEEITTVDDGASVPDAVENGQRVITSDAAGVIASDVDVVVEATGLPDSAAEHAYRAILSNKHVVMATVEADAVVGPLLADLASRMGVTYSLAYGDQPALVAELCDWARTAGLEVVAAGRGASSYDSNAAVEMCVAANATGLPPDTRGMHVPVAALDEIPNRLRPVEDGGLLRGTGVIETVTPPEDADPADTITPGVFVVVTAPQEEVQSFMHVKNPSGTYVDDTGAYLVFWRPHHLPGSETTVSVASAVLRGAPTGTPRAHVSDVVGVARTDLEPEESITVTYSHQKDGSSASDPLVSGTIERSDTAAERDHVPFGLLADATVTRPVREEDVITYDDVVLESDTVLHSLRRVQDALEPGSLRSAESDVGI